MYFFSYHRGHIRITDYKDVRAAYLTPRYALVAQFSFFSIVTIWIVYYAHRHSSALVASSNFLAH